MPTPPFLVGCGEFRVSLNMSIFVTGQAGLETGTYCVQTGSVKMPSTGRGPDYWRSPFKCTEYEYE